MSKFQTHFDTPEAAYFGFFEADRAKNADAWAAVMSYPHVRVAATGTTDYFGTSRDYADAADWTSREATGWVRTVGREPVRLHESPDRVHLLGGWTRYNAKDEPILWNRVTYIVTRPGSSWGIQARFAVGSYDGLDNEAAAGAAAAAAIRQVRRYYHALDENDGNACARLCRFPMVEAGVGEVARIENGTRLAQRASRGTDQSSNLAIRAAQSGAGGVIVALTADYASGRGEQSVLVVGRESDKWRIAGISRILTLRESDGEGRGA